MSTTDSPTPYDVLVVGSGVAGLTAALSARQAGARVAVVERAARGEHGGNTRYTEAFLRMKSLTEVSDDFEERFYDAAGYHLDPELVRESVSSSPTGLSRSQSFLDAGVLETFAEQAGPTLSWMSENGVRFAEASTPFLTASTTRLAPVGGGLAIVEAYTEACEQAGVEFLFGTTARRLVDEQGRVAGLHVLRDGQASTLSSPSVVLACGGFEGSPRMQAQYIADSRYARPVARGGYYNRGEGVEMGLAAGAAEAGDFSLFHAEPIDPRSGAPEAAIFAFTYGILVNQHGERFVDEATGTSDATYEQVTRHILQQPGGVAYAVFDEGLEDVPNYQSAIRTDQPPITGEDPQSLARALGLPVESFARTVADFNSACKEGSYTPLELDGLATSGVTPPKSNWAVALERGPYRAYPVMASNVFTFGGLKADSRGRVVSVDGDVIPGLYAAGETMGIYFGTYTGSTSVLRGAVFGRLAGADAAAVASARTGATTAEP